MNKRGFTQSHSDVVGHHYMEIGWCQDESEGMQIIKFFFS